MKRAITKLPADVGWAVLRAVGDEYDALQDARKRAGNRQGALTRKAGEALSGHGLTMAALLDVDITGRLHELEDDVATALRRTYRQVAPDCIVAWQQAQLGVGDLQLARLLGHMGHPRIAQPYRWVGTGKERVLVADEHYERTVSQLVAYCGRTGDPLRRKRVGMSAEEAFGGGKPVLKMLTYLIAGQMVMAGVRTIDEDRKKAEEPQGSGVYNISNREALSPWGQLYLDHRKLGQDRLDWTPGHQQAAALHRLAKALVKQLWEVAGEDPALPQLRAQIAAAGPTIDELVTGEGTTAPPQPRRRLVRRRS